MRRSPLIALAAASALLAAPAAAHAHGIGGEDPNRPVGEYLWLGIRHLLEGWDHLLFILALVLLAGSLWQATKLISLFVAGHSVTLMLATTQEWRVDAEVVDVVIALSVVFVAAVALRGRPKDWSFFGSALIAIGLVHGLGLGTRLLDLGVSDDSLVWRIILFNVGVEIGQAIAVLAFAAAGWALARLWSGRERALRPALTAILLAGVAGAAILSFPGDDREGRRVSDACTETAADPPPLNTAGHPPRSFYGPREEAPVEAFEHVLGDGFVVITYRPSIAAADVERLRAEIEGSRSAVVGGPDGGQASPLVARTASRRIVCSSVDMEAVTEFRDRWLAQTFGG